MSKKKGKNRQGQLGVGDYVNKGTFLKSTNGVKTVSCGCDFTFIIKGNFKK